MPERLIIQAMNVHQGGGRTLLNALLNVLSSEHKAVVLLDSRMPQENPPPEGLQIRLVKPSVFDRLSAERWLVNNVLPTDTVLCFGNLPPLFKLPGRTIVFLQNLFLINKVSLSDFPAKVWIRLAVERQWLVWRMANVDEFLVQTPTMKRLLEKKIHVNAKVRIQPFTRDCSDYKRRLPATKRLGGGGVGNFLYVASGEPHKNHRCLLEAWQYLASDNLFPSLHLTLDESRFPELWAWIVEIKRRYALKVINLGNLPHDKLQDIYKGVDALIYPSTFESFGLPLIEARQAGLPVLASELDYVRDVLDPEQTFDASSALSIARAIKRFMNKEEKSLPLMDASGFLESILKKS